MLENVYIKEKTLYLYYGKSNVGERTGVIYDLGNHLLNFLWFDLDNLGLAYSKLVNYYLNPPGKEENDHDVFMKKLSEYIDDIDRYCPYLHFYTQALIKFMMDYVTPGMNAFEELVLTATDMTGMLDTIYMIMSNDENPVPINEEFMMLATSQIIPREHVFGEQNYIDKMIKGIELAEIVILEDIKKKRERLSHEMAFIVDEQEELKGLKPLQRLYMLDYKRNQPYYTSSTFQSQFIPNHIVPNTLTTAEAVKEYLVKNDIDIVQMYEIYVIDNLIQFELLNLVSSDLLIKKCKYCGYYFVVKGRIDAEYCDRVNVGETKPCNEIGAIKNYMEKKSVDPVYQAFTKAYRRMNSKARTKRISQTEFLNWSDEARRKRDACSEEKITMFEFKKWLENK